jgi:hypothetical protein
MKSSHLMGGERLHSFPIPKLGSRPGGTESWVDADNTRKAEPCTTDDPHHGLDKSKYDTQSVNNHGTSW